MQLYEKNRDIMENRIFFVVEKIFQTLKQKMNDCGITVSWVFEVPNYTYCNTMQQEFLYFWDSVE
jgi:hypothetical protein